MKRVMWIEHKGDDGIVGPVRIGWVDVRHGGKKIVYRDQVFLSLRGRGFKSNFYDRETGDHYWISGCRKDGRNALYGTSVEIDEDAREEYWVRIRNRPDERKSRSFRASGKH